MDANDSDEKLLPVAEALGDGQPIDWDGLAAREPEIAKDLQGLKAVEKVAAAYRRQTAPEAEDGMAETVTAPDAGTHRWRSRHWIVIATIAAAVLAVVVLVVRPARGATSTWQSFDNSNGLGASHVYQVLEDGNESLWFWTSAGLSRYDGVSWESFPAPFIQGGKPISDRTGNLWYLTAGGIARFRDGIATVFSVSDGLPGPLTTSVVEDDQGRIWVTCTDANGQGGGVARFDGTTWVAFTQADGLPSGAPANILKDGRGALWVTCRPNSPGDGTGGVARYDGNTWRIFTQADGLAEAIVTDLLVDRSGGGWAGHPSGGVSHYDGVTWSAVPGTGDVLTPLYQDRAGRVWFKSFGFTTGLAVYDQGSWKRIGYDEGIPFPEIVDIAEDRAGHIWISAPPFSYAPAFFDGARWRSVGESDGLVSNEVMAMRTDGSGNLWFATYWGASRYDGSGWREHYLGMLGTVITATSDHLGRIWFGTESDGVARLDGDSLKQYTTADGLASDAVTAVLESTEGTFWFGTTRGISVFDGATWDTITTADGLPVNFVRSLYKDRSGIIWAGLGHGVARFDGSTWVTLPDPTDGVLASVQALGEDAAGNLWAGTPDYGAFRWDGTTWTRFTTADGLGSNEVVSFALDHQGSLWVGTDCGGASRLTGSNWDRFTIADGLIGECDVTVLVDRSGVVWFGTEQGGSRFDGERWQSFAPATGFANISDLIKVVEDPAGGIWFCGTGRATRYEPDRCSPQTVLVSRPPAVIGSRQASATYFAAFGETDVEFSNRLDASAWSTWSTVNTWLSSTLADGVHELEVRSRDRFGNLDATPATVRFEVDATPPEATIASPSTGGALRGTVEIRGTSSDPRFVKYQVDVRPSGASSWTPPEATVLASSTQQVTSGILATWDTSAVPDGFYDLRLVVTDAFGLTGIASMAVIVDNEFPHVDETAPAIVTAALGGDLFTTNQEMHLYFPPHAFVQDALVTVAFGAALDTLPAGASRVGPAYDLSWSGALRKAATMRLLIPGGPCPDAPGSPFYAVYDSVSAAGWQRLGGTIECGAISLSIDRQGRYAVFHDSGPLVGGRTLAGLAFTPRVLSPSTSNGVGIAFTLGQGAPVTIRVYSRSGRLVREVASERMMNAGENLVRWDGMDRNGGPVADGLYLVTVDALGRTVRQTLAVAK